MADVISLLREATRLAKEGRFEEAKKLFMEALAVAEEDPRGWFGLGVCCARLNETEDAREALEKADELGHPKARATLAKLSGGAAEPAAKPASAHASGRASILAAVSAEAAGAPVAAVQTPEAATTQIDLGKKARILLIEDVAKDRDEISAALYRTIIGCDVVNTPFAESASRTIVGLGVFDAAVMDWNTSPRDAEDLLMFFKIKQPHVPIIVLTRGWNEKMARDVMRAGADYCLVKASGYSRVLPYVIEQRFKQSFALQEKFEAELGDEHHERRRYFDSITRGVVLTNSDGEVLDANLAVADMIHVSRDRLLGEPCENLFRHEEGLDAFFPLTEAFSADEPVIVERIDPTLRRTFRVTTYQVTDAEKVEYLNLIEDITGETGPGLDAGDMADVLDSLPDAVFAKDAEGRFVYANAACASLLGKDAAELVGRKESEVAAGERAATHERNEKAVVAAGEPRYFEEIVGEVRYACRLAPVEGEAAAVLGVMGKAEAGEAGGGIDAAELTARVERAIEVLRGDA